MALPEIAEELALLLNKERLGKWFGLLLQDLDPLLQFLDQVVKLGGSRDAEVKAGLVTDSILFCYYNPFFTIFTSIFVTEFIQKHIIKICVS